MTVLLFFQIVFVCLLGAMSPGPSMMVVINNAIFKNKLNGILTALVMDLVLEFMLCLQL